MSIDESFYKNVLLLTEMVPPSYEFTRHFQKNMFDKSNTSGFIHVSHYLLELYDAERFKLLVQWPIFCKRSETNYRAEVNNYLTMLSAENPDFELPHIRASDLFHAKGLRFLTVMWKLSGIVLRAYIERECGISLLRAAKVGLANRLAETNLRTIIADKNQSVIEHHESLKQISETVHNIVKQDFDDVYLTRMRTIALKQNMQKLICAAPVNDFVKERLGNANDTEIVKMWKENVLENFEYIYENNCIFQKLSELSTTLCNIIKSYLTHLKVLDGRILLNKGADGGKDELPDLLRIMRSFTLVLDQFRSCLRLTINPLPDLKECRAPVEYGCKVLTSAQNELLPMLSLLAMKIGDIQQDLKQKSFNCVLENDDLFLFYKDLLTSPKILLQSNEYRRKEKFLQRQLYPSPEPYTHKKLFAKHKRTVNELTSRSLPKFTFDSAVWSSVNELKSPLKSLSISQPDLSLAMSSLSPQYSRLFQTSQQRTDFIRENNMSSTPYNTKYSSTRSNAKLGKQNTEKRNLTTTAKKLFNLSYEITSTLETLYKSKDRALSPCPTDKKNIPSIKITKCWLNRINDTR